MDNESNVSKIKQALNRSSSQILVLIVGILTFFFLYKFDKVLFIIRKILIILSPIIIGLLLAYLLNPAMKYFEEKVRAFLEKRMKKKREKIPAAARACAIAISFVLLFFCIYLLVYMVIPQIYSNVRNLIVTLPGQFNRLMDQLNSRMEDDRQLSALIDGIYKEAMKFLTNWVKTDMMDQVAAVATGVYGFVRVIVDVLVGIIVAAYVLMSKEVFVRQIKKTMYAFLSEKKVEGLLEVFRETDRIFGGFITGKIVDSIIIGILCFFFMLLLGLPYAALISVIIGVTNVIPFFGPYIGAVPSAFLILLTSPSKGVIFIIFILILQQFDGNILGPKILGESTGLSPFWVVFAIILGGGLFGVAGMFFGVPTLGVIYYLMKRLVDSRLAAKGREDKI